MPKFVPIARYGATASQEGASLFSGGNALSLLPARAPRAVVGRAVIGPLTVGQVASTGHEVGLSEPLAWSLVMPLAGSVLSEVNGRTLRAGPGQALLLEPGRRRTRVLPTGTEAPFRGVPILLPIDAIGARTAPSRVLDATRVLGDAQVLRMARLLYDEAAAGTGLLDRPGVAQSWAALLAELLAEALQTGNAAPRCTPAPCWVAARRVREAQAFMHAHLAEIVTIRDVARAQGMSVRTLETAFRDVHQMSPGRYLATLRLDAARQLLLSPDGSATVTEVCLACGIGHQGRFAAAYRTRFGESPSETLRRR